MNIIVCVKSCIDLEASTLVPKGDRLDEEKLRYIIGEWDQLAVQEAVRLKEEYGGKVSVVTVGAKNKRDAITWALALGADEAFHIVYEPDFPSDPFVVAGILSRVISGMKFDLVLTGQQSADENYMQTGIILAELLGVPHVSSVIKIDKIEGEKMIVHREVEGGLIEVFETTIPALLTVQTGITKPKYVTFMALRLAQKKPVKTINVADLGINIADLKRIDVKRIYEPIYERKAKIIEGDIDKVTDELLKILAELKII